jgi:hypothetical protein
MVVTEENIIEFDPVRHVYTHVETGRRIPSVTEILRVTGIRQAPVTGNSKQGRAVAAALKRGSEVHRITRELDEAGSEDVDDEFDPADFSIENINYVSAYQRFLSTSGYVPIAWEKISWLPDYNVAGRMDMVGWLGAKRILGDRKTGLAVHKSTWLQLSAYRAMWDRWNPTEKIDQTYALLLKNDMTFQLIPNPIDDGAFAFFAGAVWVHRWQHLVL